MESKGVAPNASTYNVLLNLYGKRKDVENCLNMLRTMESKDITPSLISYHTIINLFLYKLHDVDKAMYYFSDMKGKGITPDARMYDTLIETLSSMGHSAKSLELYHEKQAASIGSGAVTYSMLLDDYAKV